MEPRTKLVLCNSPKEIPRKTFSGEPLPLDYLEKDNDKRKVVLRLPDFVRSVWHLDERVLDLLEIAAYVYIADRLVLRGKRDALEYSSWARDFYFKVKVRDYEFWGDPAVKNLMAEALRFMTGDNSFVFDFEPGHTTPATSLFDTETFTVGDTGPAKITLFSGGLDSLAGCLGLLEENVKNEVCLVSHLSGNNKTKRTLNALVNAINREYNNRAHHYQFKCHLKKVHADEETQRTRSFLYSAIAFAIARAFSKNEFFVYENGVTAINIPKRQDMLNARASRTTHPKTIHLLEGLFSEIVGKEFRINTPYANKTKTDVFLVFKDLKKEHLISSAVSCSKAYGSEGQLTHCGGCTQCIDRRFAAYAAGVDDFDHPGLYGTDFITSSIDDPDILTSLVDFVRQAREFKKWDRRELYSNLLNELVDISDGNPALDEEGILDSIYELLDRHGRQVFVALEKIRASTEDLSGPIPRASLLSIISERTYLLEPQEIAIAKIGDALLRFIPNAYSTTPCANEKDLNDKIEASIKLMELRDDRELLGFTFGPKTVIPDHVLPDKHILIEAKFLRGGTTPGKAVDAIAADLTLYPDYYKLFVVYDPKRTIRDDNQFAVPLESKGKCKVLIIR